jgi:hypothetical protein
MMPGMAHDFGPTTSRPRQKGGDWTKKKLRSRRRRQQEERNSGAGPKYVHGRRVSEKSDQLPHEMRD